MDIAIAKDTLRKLNAATGSLDTDSGKVFAGFVGSLDMADGLYHGELRYEEPGDCPPETTVSIQSILSPVSAVESIEEE
jgi:hypothetical protein